MYVRLEAASVCICAWERSYLGEIDFENDMHVAPARTHGTLECQGIHLRNALAHYRQGCLLVARQCHGPPFMTKRKVKEENGSGS